MAIFVKSQREIALMRDAGKIVADTLAVLRDSIEPGMTSKQLDAIGENTIKTKGAVPAFKGYQGFPGSLCVSINDEVVHGIPSTDRVFKEGDVVSIDCGAIYKGFYGDAAITVGIGKIDQKAEKLLKVTEESLYEAIKLVHSGTHLSTVGHAVEEFVEKQGFSVVRQYCGHGIGRQMHEEPQIPNFGEPNRGPILRPGMVLAIEPMVNTGTDRTMVRPDSWTVVTEDGGLSAHFEHTVAVTDGDPEILTRA